jgi:hypothetical protein
MEKHRPELNNLNNRNNQPVFSCSGYAETRPISKNITDEDKRVNRRIDIRFTMSPPSDEDQTIVTFVKKKLQEK